jgi:hypothetical protein
VAIVLGISGIAFSLIAFGRFEEWVQGEPQLCQGGMFIFSFWVYYINVYKCTLLISKRLHKP